MTMEDYLAARFVVEPFRLFDCCLETDGAVALVLTRAERAGDLRRTPVLIRGAAWGGGQTLYSNEIFDTTRTSAADMAPRLYAMAGVGPADFDLAELYDCFTYSVLVQLEDYGFCAKGEGGPFVASGATARGGRIPVNTHGGFLSEGYVHGLNHVAEAVSQLRHEAGARQVPNAEVALSTAQPGYVAGSTAALVLRRGD
jgi:acetyl-CoA acetyltransferase